MPNSSDPTKGGLTPPPPVAPSTPVQAVPVPSTEIKEESEDK